ncbi:hypothetical protein [Streptomyces sp. SM11]|uniref:hypothetical protein n=1 Tax=Streptomyces sp. SM11 TaxID=565557 RepID=UPI0021561358|nr:hypothetical protein [Streptomyces sp. SM11]
MSTGRGRHRRTRTLQAAVVVAVTAGLAGVWPTSTPDDARAAGTVVVSTTPELENAFANAGPGTTIQLRGGTYRPAPPR